MDFLVNPSTFSDAEMADILVHKLTKCIRRVAVSLGSNERFPPPAFPTVSHQRQITEQNCLRWSSSPVRVLFCMIQHGRWVGFGCVRLCPRAASLACFFIFENDAQNHKTKLMLTTPPALTTRSEHHKTNSDQVSTILVVSAASSCSQKVYLLQKVRRTLYLKKKKKKLPELHGEADS